MAVKQTLRKQKRVLSHRHRAHVYILGTTLLVIPLVETIYKNGRQKRMFAMNAQ